MHAVQRSQDDSPPCNGQSDLKAFHKNGADPPTPAAVWPDPATKRAHRQLFGIRAVEFLAETHRLFNRLVIKSKLERNPAPVDFALQAMDAVAFCQFGAIRAEVAGAEFVNATILSEMIDIAFAASMIIPKRRPGEFAGLEFCVFRVK